MLHIILILLAYKNGCESEKGKMMSSPANRKISLWLTPLTYRGNPKQK